MNKPILSKRRHSYPDFCTPVFYCLFEPEITYLAGMINKSWKKQGGSYTISPVGKSLVKVVFNRENGLILTCSRQLKVHSEGMWIRRFRIIQHGTQAARWESHHFERKSTLELHAGTKYRLICNCDGSLRWLDQQSNCLVLYPDPFRNPMEMQFIPDGPDLDLLLGLSLLIGKQIQDELAVTGIQTS